MATVQNINQILNYQDGSVVSKMIINKPTGTVTMFAFGLGEGLSEHIAPFDALLIATDGRAEITLSGEIILSQRGRCCLCQQILRMK